MLIVGVKSQKHSEVTLSCVCVYVCIAELLYWRAEAFGYPTLPNRMLERTRALPVTSLARPAAQGTWL